jgi:hypothetical protein
MRIEVDQTSDVPDMSDVIGPRVPRHQTLRGISNHFSNRSPPESHKTTGYNSNKGGSPYQMSLWRSGN